MNLAHLTTEGRNPASDALDRLSSLEIVRLMNVEDGRVPEAVGSIADSIAQAIDLIAERLMNGGRLIYLGAGTSGRLGVLDAAECPPTFNSPPWQVVGLIAGGATALTRAVEGAEDQSELAIDDLRRLELSHRDVLVGIATSGRTPYVIAGLRFARSMGACAIGLTCNEDAELNRVSDLTLRPIVGPEIITGSTRLKAGTATKLVLNMLSTGAMVRLGKSFGNLMVDLQSTNKKLADRSERIVASLTGLARDQAGELLNRCDGDVKTSLIVHQRGVTIADARQLLERSHGRLRDALEDDAAVPVIASPIEQRDLVIGVDGGGSKTLVWLTDADSAIEAPIGIGQAGPSNPLVAGWHAALAHIDLAIDRAFTAAEIPRRQAQAAYLAVAGTGRAAERQRLETWAAQRRLAERTLVTHDAMPVLAAGTSAGFGIAVISGTGSFAFGRNAQGREARAGGWGQILGDEGSGYAIARAGLQAVTQAHDGTGPATHLSEALCRALNVATVMDLRDAVSSDNFNAQRVAALAPVVIATADAGDEPSIEIVEAAARGLASLVLAVHRQLRIEPDHNDCELAFSGALLVHSKRLREWMLEALSDTGLRATRIQLVDEPVRGTICLARAIIESSR